MESYKDRMLRKQKELGISSSEMLDRITDFLCDTEGMTTEELKEDLEDMGIDTERAINRMYCLLEIYGFTPYP